MVHTAKLRELILVIARHPAVANLGLIKLYKLIYFIDVRTLRELGRSVTGSDFIKYEHGPVPSRAERELKRMKKDGVARTEQRDFHGHEMTAIEAIRDPDESVFDAEEKAIIDDVCTELGKKSGKNLSDISHREPAWLSANLKDKLDAELMYYGASEDSEGL